MPTIDDVYGTAAMPVVVTPPAVQPKVDALAKFTGEIGAALKADALDLISVKVVPVQAPEAAAHLHECRAKAKLLLKDIEHRRKLVVEPLNKEVGAVNAEAHRWADPVIAWDKQAEQALLAYRRFQEDQRQREERVRQAAVELAARQQLEAEAAGNLEQAEAASLEIMKAEAAPVTAPVKGWKTDAGTSSLRKVWKVEVVDASLLPPAYLVPDLQKLQAAVDAGAREIEGCSIAEHESLPVRTRG